MTAGGKAWTKVKTWFGYTLHLMADTTWEIPVAATLTKASASEVKTLEGMLEEVFAESPDLAMRCKDLSADRGLRQWTSQEDPVGHLADPSDHRCAPDVARREGRARP